MPELEELRSSALEIVDAALTCVDARAAVRTAVACQGPEVKIGDRVFETGGNGIYVVALGKAATSMTLGLNDALRGSITRAVVSGPGSPETQFPVPKHWQFFHGGHPLPNEASLLAAWCAFELLDEANKRSALVIFLISGGGSAMMEFPRYENITLEDLREANRQLVGCGAAINEINAVRRAFSAVKGDGLAARAPQAQQISLIVSDTNEGHETDVASGPTLPIPKDTPEPKDIVATYKLNSLPPSILNAIERYQHESQNEPKAHQSYVLLSNQTALTAASDAAKSLGFAVKIARDICEQPIEQGCDLLISRMMTLLNEISERNQAVCVVSGGEFSCPVRGDGIGGRNLETVLRCAIKLDQARLAPGVVRRPHVVILSVGTDGIDGNSPAAGAIADEKTLARSRSRDLDPAKFLKNSDAFRFFTILGDAIMTGPTGTNVRDLRIILASL